MDELGHPSLRGVAVVISQSVTKRKRGAVSTWARTGSGNGSYTTRGLTSYRVLTTLGWYSSLVKTSWRKAVMLAENNRFISSWMDSGRGSFGKGRMFVSWLELREISLRCNSVFQDVLNEQPICVYLAGSSSLLSRSVSQCTTSFFVSSVES
jgi:hypothetical protein